MSQTCHLHFNGKWRTYQQRILDSLDVHLRDKKLHIVAAPGAGKTILGIEVIARLGRPTLILCPTNTIKSQWRERICSSFLREEDHDAVSTRLREPGYLTVITYQALLAAFCGNDDPGADSNAGDTPGDGCGDSESIASSARFQQEKADEIIGILRAAGVSLLCFDEAHHLRREWWKALTYLNERLQPDQTLALTATPPYDADHGEWKRYRELCGEIDEVISIPELVKNGDLCPHQDYICFSSLQRQERELLERHKQHVRTFVEMIQNDTALLEGLSKMRFFEAKDSDIEMIFDSPQFYVAIASLLNSKGYRIAKPFLELFDARQSELPAFDTRWASVFIKGFLESAADCFKPLEAKRSEYHEAARRLGLVANGKVVLADGSPRQAQDKADSSQDKIRRLMAGSVGKLDSIVQIVRLESGQLKEQLRMVVLTDYIRIDDTACQSVGVVPIWRRLVAEKAREGLPHLSIGVLCGSLILLPEKAKGRLFELMADGNIAEETVTIGRFDDNQDYIRVTPKERLRNHIVGLITEMFCAGDLTVLIGTQALLGEGWDAPAVNSLILSSTVSSYMLSNQMRGRAIRVDKSHPEKVSNIWHLATIDPSDTSDLDQLATRFKGFEAPSYYGKHEITSGIERILDRVPTAPGTHSRPKAYPREEIRRWWNDALRTGPGYSRPTGLATGVQISQTVPKTLLYTGFKHKIITFFAVVLILYWFLMQSAPYLLPLFTVAALVAAAIFLGVITVKYLRTGTVERVMRQVATTVLETMSCQGAIRSSVKNAGLSVTDSNGMLFVSCTRLPTEENNLFVQSLQELLDPVDNPRYLLVRHSTFLGRVRQRDYFSIPALLSANKKHVDLFKRLWEKHVGKCEVAYTRNPAGRRLLLKARKDASSASQRERSRRLSKWQ